MARFNAMYEEYVKNPLITKQRMFFETMEEVLPDLKVIIGGSQTNMQTVLPLDSFTGNTDAGKVSPAPTAAPGFGADGEQ